MSGILHITDKKYSLRATPKTYSINITRWVNSINASTAGWDWAETVNVPVTVSVVTDAQLANDLAPVIFLNNVSTNWNKAGIVHNKNSGTLDFSNYIGAETPGEGEFAGYIDFQYKA